MFFTFLFFTACSVHYWDIFGVSLGLFYPQNHPLPCSEQPFDPAGCAGEAGGEVGEPQGPVGEPGPRVVQGLGLRAPRGLHFPACRAPGGSRKQRRGGSEALRLHPPARTSGGAERRAKRGAAAAPAGKRSPRRRWAFGQGGGRGCGERDVILSALEPGRPWRA